MRDNAEGRAGSLEATRLLTLGRSELRLERLGGHNGKMVVDIDLIQNPAIAEKNILHQRQTGIGERCRGQANDAGLGVGFFFQPPHRFLKQGVKRPDRNAFAKRRPAEGSRHGSAPHTPLPGKG